MTEVHDWSDQLYAVAQLYYVQGDTMDGIARQLGTSRSTISRMLRQARDSGLVRITVAHPARQSSSVAATVERLFGVRIHLVAVRDQASEVLRLDRVARVAADLISETVASGMTVGVAWGTTMAAIAQHLRPIERSEVVLVQLNGGANPVTTGIPYVTSIMAQLANAWGASQVLFPVPAFFDYEQTREAMWRERSIRHVTTLQHHADLAIFGVGSIEGRVPSHVYSGGYLDEADMAELRAEKVVGDVCTVLLREDGSWRDVQLNRRASGLTPAELGRIPRRIMVAAGASKGAPLLAALRARVATDVVLDDEAAKAVLARM